MTRWNYRLGVERITVTTADLRRLRDRAARVYDGELFTLAEAALGGDDAARAECARIVAEQEPTP